MPAWRTAWADACVEERRGGCVGGGTRADADMEELMYAWTDVQIAGWRNARADVCVDGHMSRLCRCVCVCVDGHMDG